MKKRLITAVIIILLLAVFLVIYPFIEIDTGSRLIRCSYSSDISEYDQNHSYNELYCYNEKRDISISSFEVENFLFFYTIKMEYIDGDFRETQFVLEESYIDRFLTDAEMISNDNNIQLASLIEGKTAVVSNTRYTGNDYTNGIFYKLDGRYEEMYIFYSGDLLVVQVDSPDELPKFIAYK